MADYLIDPDVILMLKFKQGDKLAFDELLDKYHRRVINIAYRMIGDRYEADDLAQEVFIRVYNSSGNYQPTAKFSTWIYKITMNLCLNELRRRKKKVFSLDEDIPTQEGQVKIEIAEKDKDSPPDTLAKKELQDIVKKAIESLPENQRVAVLLRRYENMPYEDIAGTMNCSVSAVKSLLNRAKEALKEKLVPYIKD